MNKAHAKQPANKQETKVVAVTSVTNEKHAIEFLKRLGYKIMRPVVTHEEV